MDELTHAGEVLTRGGVIAHATEGVWGLSCDPDNPAAVARIISIKGRDLTKGLIVIGADADAFAAELHAIDGKVSDDVRASWPGPHTWILPNVRFSQDVTGGRDTVACRVPGHVQARAIADLFGGPIVSTSANRTGQDAAVSEHEVREWFADEVDLIVSGAVLNPGVPSTIHTPDGKILRQGVSQS